MKFFQKRGVAWVVLVLAIAASCLWGLHKKPADLPEVKYYQWICDEAGLLSEETEKTIRRLLNTPGMNVLIMRQPCATLMSKKKKRPVKVYVDQNVCWGDGCGCDKYCSRVWGCPGNTWDFKNNKAYIDPVTCVGCGVCAKLCPSGAIKVEGGEEA